MTKLSINQLTQIAGHIRCEGLSAARDKPSAVARVIKASADFGISEKGAFEIMDCDSAVAACKKVDELKRTAIPPAPKEEEKTMNDTTTIEKPEAKKRGRTSSNAGRTLVALVDFNPRREGSKGHHSMQLILDAGKNGIKYEDYIAGGGRNNDLAWDIEHGAVKVE